MFKKKKSRKEQWTGKNDCGTLLHHNSTEFNNSSIQFNSSEKCKYFGQYICIYNNLPNNWSLDIIFGKIPKQVFTDKYLGKITKKLVAGQNLGKKTVRLREYIIE